MKKFLKTPAVFLCAFIVIFSAGCGLLGRGDNAGDNNGGDKPKLVWQDEFDGNSLDMTKWSFQTGTRDYYGESVGANYWGNEELQYYTEENLTVDGGLMKITAKREDAGDRTFTSSRIITRDKFFRTYGYFEARIKLPALQGMWPAFWLLPQPTDETSSSNVYGGWAANGEIDIMEAKGRLPYGVDTTIHFGGRWPNNKYKGHTTELEAPISEWHVYAVDWRENYIAWFIDGKEVYRLSNDEWDTTASDNPSAPFDQPFFILFNLAVGGKYDGGRKPDEHFSEASMYVDYVRVYE